VEDALTCEFEGARVSSGDELPLHVPAEACYLFDAEGKAFRRLGASAAAAGGGMSTPGRFQARIPALCAEGRPVKPWLCAAATALICSAAPAKDDLKLLVWINGDKGYNGLQRVGDAFEKLSGVRSKCSTPKARPRSSNRPPAPARGRTSSAGRTTAWASGPRPA
jgi:hypothetical protein